MASSAEVDIRNEVVLTDAEEGELAEVLSSVISKRRSVPKRCMDMYREIIGYEIKSLEDAEVKLEENEDKKKILNYVHELSSSKPVKLSFEDVREAEENILKCQKRLTEINNYLRRRNAYIKE